MLVVNTEIHLQWQVQSEAVTVSALLPLLRSLRAESCAARVAWVLDLDGPSKKAVHRRFG